MFNLSALLRSGDRDWLFVIGEIVSCRAKGSNAVYFYENFSVVGSVCRDLDLCYTLKEPDLSPTGIRCIEVLFSSPLGFSSIAEVYNWLSASGSVLYNGDGVLSKLFMDKNGYIKCTLGYDWQLQGLEFSDFVRM